MDKPLLSDKNRYFFATRPRVMGGVTGPERSGGVFGEIIAQNVELRSCPSLSVALNFRLSDQWAHTTGYYSFMG